MKITEQFILSNAPNSGAVSNGKNLSRKNSFSGLKKTADETLIWGDCTGSGKNPYHTSLDFSDPETPVFRCSCPSRQIPCKHAVALLYDWLAEKNFEIAEIPQEIADKRAKKEARLEKKKAGLDQPKKVNTAARTKKLKKQLEGLDLAEKMASDLITSGINTLAGTSVSTYENLAKELGNYYLPGPQLLVSRIALEVSAIQNAPDTADFHYKNAVRLLLQLTSTIRKARVSLTEKLDRESVTPDDSVLYEALGGIWKLEELKAIGSYQENAELCQLSFDVSYDEARREYIDRGYWINLGTGEISQTLNYRPVKALKYVKAEDTNFHKVHTSELFYYPGEINRRIRWEGCTYAEIRPETISKIREMAQPDTASAVKLLKNQIKNTLSPKYAAMLLPFSQIGTCGGQAVLEDASGGRILLRDMPGDPSLRSLYRIFMLPDAGILKDNCLFGILFFDESDRRICIQPYSIVTKDDIIRLQY